MKNIVTIKHNSPSVSIKNVADFAGLKEKSVADLLSDNRDKFLELGLVLPSGRGAVLSRSFLDEYQAALLITFMKNTPAVVRFKTDLMLQFKALREKEMLKMQRKLTDATSMKTYRYGQVSLRKYLRDSGKAILEEDAWQELEDLGIIETRIVPVKTRHLLDTSFGSQQYKTLSFDASMLDTVL